MTNRNPISTTRNIWFDAEQVDNSDLQLEQNYNNTVQSGIINNHIGSGVVPEVLTQNVIFDSSLVTNFLDGIVIPYTDSDFHISQPADSNYGNQLEIELTNSIVCGRKTIKLCIIGLDFQNNLQYETFVFKVNEIQITHKHFTRVLALMFNDFIGDPGLSLNLGGRIIIREAKPYSLSRSPIMTSQDQQPNLFFRDFFLVGGVSLTTALETALPYYSTSSLNITTTNNSQKVLEVNDVTTQIGQKFIATTNNIQKITLLLSVRNQEEGSESDLSWTGDLLLSIYPLQTNIECPTDVVPNLDIDFSPANIPVAQISLNYDTLRAMGIVLDDGYGSSVPQPVDFIFSNSSVAGGNILNVGSYYAFTLKRSGSANKCDILIEAGENLTSNSRITMFTGTVWADLPNEDLWFRIYTDAAKISDGQAYEAGNGLVVPKTIFDTETSATIDYSYKDIQFTGNDLYKAVIATTISESVPVADPRTGQNINSRQQYTPEVNLLNPIDIVNLQSATEPLIIGSITDKNKKFFDPATSTFTANLHAATIADNEIIVKIITDTTDTGRYDDTVTALETNILNGDFIGAKITPNSDKPAVYYRISEAKLCTMIMGDVNGDGIVDEDDLDLLNSYVGFNLNSGLPLNSIITTDGYTTSYSNGYSAFSSPFNNSYSVTFQLVNKNTNVVAGSGTDGVLIADTSDPRLGQFTAVSIDFNLIVGLSDYKLVILSPNSDSNIGAFDIVGLDTITDSITIRKIVLTGDSICQLLRADINCDFAITTNDGYLLGSYIERIPYVGSPSPTYPAPTTDPYTLIGTKFNVLRLKVEKFEDRNDDYYTTLIGRSSSIHQAQDIFINDGYVAGQTFASNNFYTNPISFVVQKQLNWDESLIISNSRPRMVPSVFTTSSGSNIRSCTLDGITCSTYPVLPQFDSGRVDLFAPDNIIIGEGEIQRADGSLYKVDFEVGTIVLEIPNGLYASEKTINILQDFIASDVDGSGLPLGRTRLGFPAMRFADCSYVDLYALQNDQVRFSVAVQSFSPNTNGTIDGYEGVIVDGKMGVSVDYSTGLITLNFTNLYEDIIFETLSTKIQVSVYLKKGGFNNEPLFVDSTKVQNILSLISVFNGPGSAGPATLIDLETESTGILPIVHGGTGLNATGAYGSILMSSGGALSYQFLYDGYGVISSSSGVSDAGRIVKTDGYGLIDPSFIYKNPVEIYGVAGLQQTGSATPVAIGAFPFNYTKYISNNIKDIKLEVILESTNAGNTAEIQLYNVTTASYVTLLDPSTFITTAATTATYLYSDDLSLPTDNTDYIYEIHLDLNGGSMTENAVCKMARLVITYQLPTTF